MKTMKLDSLLFLLMLWAGSLSLLHAQNDHLPMGKELPFFTEPPKEVNSIGEGSLFQTVFDLNGKESFELVGSQKDPLGYTHDLYQQYYNGIKVEGALYKVHAQKGTIKLLSGHYHDIFEEVNITPSVREFSALATALNHVKGKQYLWDTPGEMPRGELVILADPKGIQSPILTYKFDIYSLDPLYRAYVFIDAHEGTFVTEHPIIHHTDVAASGSSLYNGTVNFTADDAGSNYRLRQKAMGNGVETYSLNNGTNYRNATDITSNSTFFNSDDTGVQAHWGAEQTYQYFLEKHGRSSYDGNGAVIKSYVHYATNYVNAFWDGSRMTYGDGDGENYGPLVSLDIVGHELAHGVTQFSADLIYRNESGALNESFSDIFGEAIERFASGSNDWLMGHDIGLSSSGAFRSLKNPNQFRDPDTYGGTYWYTGSGDNGGVHINSGVQNKWFYILSEGESGTNDLGDSYSVEGIGMEKAAEIAYRNLSVYLSPSSNYFDARLGAIQAAKDLFGEGSAEEIATTNAWYAVGVGGEYGSSAYCSSSGRNASFEWIANVTVGEFSNTSGSAGYSNFTFQKIELFPNRSYNISLSPDFSGTIYQEWWKIWIDYNIDGDFDDEGELVFDSKGLSPSTVTGFINIPSYAFGETRMRVSMKWDGEQTSSCEVFSYGEVEDYTVSFSTSNDDEPPSAPPNLTASNITETSVKLSWSASSDNSEVVLYKVYVDGRPFGSTNTLSYTLTGLDPGTTYSMSVTAEDRAGNDSPPSTIQVTTLGNSEDNEPPSPPSSLIALNTTSQSTHLYWSAAADNVGVVGYKVYVNNAFYAATTATNLVVNDLSPSTTYTMSVSAVDAAGNESIKKSTSVTTLDAPDTEAPSQPGNLTASNTTTSGTNLSWTASTDNVGVSHYTVFRGSTLLGTTSTTSFGVTGLNPATTYTFFVRAEDAAGNQSSFASVQVTTLSEADTEPPSPPGNLTASDITISSAKLSWQSSSDNIGVTGYRVYVNGVLRGSTTSLSYTVNGLSAATTYTMEVSAVDAAGNESEPAEINVTTLPDMDDGLVVLGAYYFEEGWDGWTDGGYDCDRHQGPFAWEGSYAIRLRDNSGQASSMISPTYDLRYFSEVELEFAFYARSMESGEDFHVKFWDGSTWETIATFTSGEDFFNNNFYGVSVKIGLLDHSFNANNQFAIQCDASANSDQVYIDAVRVIGHTGGLYPALNSQIKLEAKETTVKEIASPLLSEAPEVDSPFTATTIKAVEVYPNPAREQLYVKVAEDVKAVRLLDGQGQIIKEMLPADEFHLLNLDISNLTPGLYFLQIQTEEAMLTKRIVKQ
jgi:bacillolysin